MDGPDIPKQELPVIPIIHLICNAHIDPVWLWEWQEGAAVAISTFHTAADLCEEFDTFIFNHNEALLYRWIEEYDPELFTRIQKLVTEGKWHIMGGWFLQPDCNMPSGESLVRQILLGRNYFKQKFNKAPRAAINFDPFGHSRGLVQILKKSGYDSYVFCRPSDEFCHLERDSFIWEGFDGSRILADRPWGHYLSATGMAAEKVRQFLETRPDGFNSILLWGVGNHGGGPSRRDILELDKLINSTMDKRIVHSTPEAFFDGIRAENTVLPVYRGSLNPYDVGCYTSQILVKQAHRQLENDLFMTEKMATSVWAMGLMDYPDHELEEATYDLLTAEFHDILPGSAIQPVEQMALRMIGHGLEILSRVRARAFFTLAKGQSPAKEGEIPVLVYNPHPYPTRGIVECEFQLADPNPEGIKTLAIAYDQELALPSQIEKEEGNVNLDWRKRIVFVADLQPSRMNRFDCSVFTEKEASRPSLPVKEGCYYFHTDDLEVLINQKTGFINGYSARGTNYLAPNAFTPLVMHDSADPWGMETLGFNNEEGRFKLLSDKDSALFSGVDKDMLPGVRIIEDGPVRSVVEAVYGYNHSFICQQFKLPKQGCEIEVELFVFWNEKDRMLKLSIPTVDSRAAYLGQQAYGIERLAENRNEAVAQKWVAVVFQEFDYALTIINDGIYGSDYSEGEARISLLRSAAYSAHPQKGHSLIPDDRFQSRIDQGERRFKFWLQGGPKGERLGNIDREALSHNEKPMALSFFPHGGGKSYPSFVTLSDSTVILSCFKKAENSEKIIIRLFEPTGQSRRTMLSIPLFGIEKEINLGGFEIASFIIDYPEGLIEEVNLVEESL